MAIRNVDYFVTDFNVLSGVASIYIPLNESNLSVDIPVIDGEYISGDALDEYMQGMIPTWIITRRNDVASATNASVISSLVVAHPNPPQINTPAA